MLKDFNQCLEQCKTPVMADLSRLGEKIKEHLQWSDMKLLRSILVLIETKARFRKEKQMMKQGHRKH
jgi:hypothetical protein